MIGQYIIKIIVGAFNKKIYLIFIVLLSSCTTSSAHKSLPSVANDIYFSRLPGNIVSNCRNSAVGSHKTAEIVCFETAHNVDESPEAFPKLEQRLRDAGWKTPEQGSVLNARKRIPSDVSDENFFVLKMDGSDPCNWSSVTVFVDAVFMNKDNLPRMKISLNRLYDGCKTLI